jgi:hypothetical protein
VQIRGSGPQLDAATGWHAKRQEFDPEWDNDAETAIAEIEFRPDDTPQETAMKLRNMEIYNKRLDEVRAAAAGVGMGTGHKGVEQLLLLCSWAMASARGKRQHVAIRTACHHCPVCGVCKRSQHAPATQQALHAQWGAPALAFRCTLNTGVL